jgi:hypothetical protein
MHISDLDAVKAHMHVQHKPKSKKVSDSIKEGIVEHE